MTVGPIQGEVLWSLKSARGLLEPLCKIPSFGLKIMFDTLKFAII